jgi:hypothetical protein
LTPSFAAVPIGIVYDPAVSLIEKKLQLLVCAVGGLRLIHCLAPFKSTRPVVFVEFA